MGPMRLSKDRRKASNPSTAMYSRAESEQSFYCNVVRSLLKKDKRHVLAANPRTVLSGEHKMAPNLDSLDHLSCNMLFIYILWRD
jgi:hypothetical protein